MLLHDSFAKIVALDVLQAVFQDELLFVGYMYCFCVEI